MLNEEVITLIAIREAGEFSRKQTNGPREIDDKRINDLRNQLVSGGYLAVDNPERYQLSSKGRNAILMEAIQLVNCDDDTWVRYRIQKIEHLYKEIDRQSKPDCSLIGKYNDPLPV